MEFCASYMAHASNSSSWSHNRIRITTLIKPPESKYISLSSQRIYTIGCDTARYYRQISPTIYRWNGANTAYLKILAMGSYSKFSNSTISWWNISFCNYILPFFAIYIYCPGEKKGVSLFCKKVRNAEMRSQSSFLFKIIVVTDTYKGVFVQNAHLVKF